MIIDEMEKKMIVNGKEYLLWSQFVEKKEEFIGGTLEDGGDSFDNMMFGEKVFTTKITDIQLNPNGEDSAFFLVVGEDFECGFDVKYGGVVGGEKGWLNFHGYGGHTFRIHKP